jgi:hypothetical protein
MHIPNGPAATGYELDPQKPKALNRRFHLRVRGADFFNF